MAVTDSYCNTQSEFSDSNKCREEENPEMLFASPEQGTEKKKKRRKKKIEQESNQETQFEVCAKPLVDKEENAETTAHNSTPKKKKKKNKNEQSELQLRTCDPISISIGTVEPDVIKEEGLQQGADDGNGDLCVKPLLDTPIPIVPQQEKAEATTQNPNPSPKKKKKKHIQICDPSITLGVEHDVMKEEGAHQGDDNGNKDLCATHEIAVEELPVPDSLPPEDTSRKKKSSRRKKSAETEAKESNDTDNPQHCFVDMEPENKVEKGSEINADQSQVCSKLEFVSTSDIASPGDIELRKRAEPIDTKEEHPQACSEPELASSIDLSTAMNLEKKKGAELSEAHTQQRQPCTEHEPAVPGINEECPLPDPTPPEDTPRKKKNKKKVENQGSPLHMDKILNQTTNVEKEKGAESSEGHAQQPQPCSEHESMVPGMNEECPLPDPTPVEDTPRKKKKKKKVENQGSPLHMDTILNQTTNVEKKTGAESSEGHAQQPQRCSEYEPTVPGMNEECPLPDPTPLEDSPQKNKKKKKMENQGSPLHKKTWAELIEGHAQQPQPCSEHEPTVPVMNEECPLPDPTPLEDTPQKKKKKKKVENQGSPLQIDKTLDQTTIQVEQDPTTPICLQPESPTDQTIPVDPAIPIDTEQKTKKRKRKKQRNVLDGEEPNDDKHNTEQPEIPIVTSDCLIAAPPIDPAIPVDPSPAISICSVISTDLEQEMSKKKRRKKRKSEGAEPNEHSIKPPEFPVQESIYPIAAPSIDPTIPIDPAPPVDTATPIDQDEKLTEKKRKKKKSALRNEGAESSEHEGKPPEIPVQSFVYSIVAHSIDPEIPDSAPSIDTATPIVQGQSSSKKKRKSAPISEGAKPNEHDGKLPGTPAQGNTIAAPLIDLTIPSSQAPPVDPATPVDQEQMTKKKRKKERRSEPKNKGLESEKHNADLTVETPAQKTEGPTTENSMSMYNAEPSEETLVQRTDSLRVTRSPSKMVCRACRQPGHIYLYCQRLKRLSKNEEVCFFCLEIGHSLGKCSAGGGRFAKCLLCYEHGHFSYNCPRHGHGIDPKVVASNGAINRSVEAEGEPDDDIKEGHQVKRK